MNSFNLLLNITQFSYSFGKSLENKCPFVAVTVKFAYYPLN